MAQQIKRLRIKVIAGSSKDKFRGRIVIQSDGTELLSTRFKGIRSASGEIESIDFLSARDGFANAMQLLLLEAIQGELK